MAPAFTADDEELLVLSAAQAAVAIANARAFRDERERSVGRHLSLRRPRRPRTRGIDESAAIAKSAVDNSQIESDLHPADGTVVRSWADRSKHPGGRKPRWRSALPQDTNCGRIGKHTNAGRTARIRVDAQMLAWVLANTVMHDEDEL